jgi:O-antigen ligase
MWWPTLLFAGVLCFITFYAKGGLNLESMTTTEVVLTLGSGVLVASAAMLARTATRTYGLAALALMLAFTMLTAVSIVWSVRPDDSWQEAGRLLAYTGVFAAGSALVRIAPERWPALLGAIVLAAVIVCGYALTTKVFPGTFATTNTFARLEEPYGYWNAIGLTAALGVVACMWLGARRSGHALLRALAYPAMGLLALTLALAYSRGALVALALSLALWFCLVPRRLRAVALLVAGALGAGGVAAWDFSTHALSSEGIALAQRASAGHRLGALIVAMVALLTAVGVAVGFLSGRRAPSQATRQRAGAAVLAGLLVLALAFAGALAHSQRGLTGSVSHAFHSLTNPNAKPPPNTPGRLTAVASVRARYWKEALQIFDAHPALGAGAGGYDTARLRYRTETLEVRHAHGFVVQTLADLGVVGLALALALLVAWMAAAGTATHPFNRSWTSWRSWRDMRTGARPGWRRLTDRRLTSYTPERVGLLTMLCIVVCFGVHSLIDWTWYVPGNACVALLCAGWLAGRGPLTPTTGAAEHAVHPGATTQADGVGAEQAAGVSAEPASAGPRGAWSEQPRNVRIALAAAAIVAALLAVWSQLQPQRAEESRQQALALLASNPAAASAAAHRAVDRDPLSSEALFTLANVQQVTGHPTLARATLVRAVRKQPSNPQTWLVLGRYDLTRNPQASAKELQAAIFLDPESISPEAIAVGNHEAIEIHNDYIHALSAAVALRSASESRARATAAARRARPRRSARRSTRSGSRPAGR